MISYTGSGDPANLAQKNFIESLERALKKLNAEGSGNCHATGYEIEARVKRHPHLFHLHYYKKQNTASSGNKTELPLDEVNTKVRVEGLSLLPDLSLQKSKLKRLTISRQQKELLPAPFVLLAKQEPPAEFLKLLSKKITDHEISTFEIENGTLSVSLHAVSSNPLELISFLEQLLAIISLKG
jgi:hypothetical protein